MMNPSWKKYQKQIKIKRKARQVLLLGGTIFILGSVFFTARFFRWLNRPLSVQLNGDGKVPILEKGQQVNLLVAGKYEGKDELCWLLAAALDREGGTARLLLIPVETVEETEEGEYPLKKLLEVGKALNPPRPLAFLHESLQDFLAVPLDGYVLWGGECFDENDLAEKVLNQYREWQSVFFWPRVFTRTGEVESKLTTNLSRYQFWRLLGGSRGVREDKLQILDLRDCSDIFDIELRDKMVQSVFVDRKVREENLKLWVRNGTAIAGQAAFAARFVENLGAEVLIVDNYERVDVEVSQIKMYQEKGSQRTLGRLKQILCADEVASFPDQVARVDAEVVVGEKWVAGERRCRLY